MWEERELLECLMSMTFNSSGQSTSPTRSFCRKLALKSCAPLIQKLKSKKFHSQMKWDISVFKSHLHPHYPQESNSNPLLPLDIIITHLLRWPHYAVLFKYRSDEGSINLCTFWPLHIWQIWIGIPELCSRWCGMWASSPWLVSHSREFD